jgi:hypothetical protein
MVTPEEPMSKVTRPRQTTVFCGIDVSAATLAVAVIEPDPPLQRREFANRSSGHKALIVWPGKGKARVRVSLEATGIYSLDLALLWMRPRILSGAQPDDEPKAGPGCPRPAQTDIGGIAPMP